MIAAGYLESHNKLYDDMKIQQSIIAILNEPDMEIKKQVVKLYEELTGRNGDSECQKAK